MEVDKIVEEKDKEIEKLKK